MRRKLTTKSQLSYTHTYTVIVVAGNNIERLCNKLRIKKFQLDKESVLSFKTKELYSPFSKPFCTCS